METCQIYKDEQKYLDSTCFNSKLLACFWHVFFSLGVQVNTLGVMCGTEIALERMRKVTLSSMGIIWCQMIANA